MRVSHGFVSGLLSGATLGVLYFIARHFREQLRRVLAPYGRHRRPRR